MPEYEIPRYGREGDEMGSGGRAGAQAQAGSGGFGGDQTGPGGPGSDQTSPGGRGGDQTEKGKVRVILPVEPQNYTGDTHDVLIEVVTGDNKKGIGRIASPPGAANWVEEGELVYYTTLNDGPVPYVIHSTRPK